MAKYAQLNQSNFPIVTVTFAPFEPSLAEFNDYLNDLKNLLNQKKPTLQIYDASQSRYLPSELRIRQGNWMKEHDALIKQYTIGTAYVIPSVMVRMILNGIFLIQKPSAKYTIVATMPEAMEWADKQVAQQAAKA